jgi:hypothetical protein
MIYDPTAPTVDAEHQPKANACFAYTWYKQAIELHNPLADENLAKLLSWALDAAAKGDQCAQQLVSGRGRR